MTGFFGAAARKKALVLEGTTEGVSETSSGLLEEELARCEEGRRDREGRISGTSGDGCHRWASPAA
jgi:hypothetical protein